jgi:pimeloyl-ACP methyl ester carboxylesterase
VKDETPAAAYAALKAPALLITGEHSTVAAHATIRRLAAALPSASVFTVPGAGHMGPLTHADVVNQVIVDWVASR